MNQNKGIILVTLPNERFGSIEMEALRSQAEGREIIHALDRPEMEKYLDQTEILIGFGPWDLPAKMPNLRWFQLWGAGVDGLVAHPELKDHAVSITNTSGMHRDQLTEHIFGMILSRNRFFPKVFAAQKKHEWVHPKDSETDVLAGKTMLIIGYGAIGEQTAIAAKAFGMKVIGIRRHPANPGADVRIETMDKLGELLGEADYVVNILPFTEETKGILGKKEFNLFKRGAVYVNVGRGPTNDEAAMMEALKSGRLAAALLDVTSVEPLPKDSPLWDMENVIITPHYAGTRNNYAAFAMEITLENLKRYNKGQPLEHLVDKKAGY
ncbi:D-2-hydroxyacid dehydrogenase [Leadbettera azotonutricia]|uniref:Erythronate-4-phosphate dehydrogenase domain protein n=1 Tax=Leadbettera azotonutricia (strain ATCC BAA-888 / DSM 13862 / ZAS-9) TaxID=545695 RepID=F5YD35_LEAAZ|nr:D-2-hydroxyacid dehydrogenase [Leadbettera azotonutricia]AEF81273.1 erythronate-4-phosphate dehydrogenase domain protein [Leadbettera azotonutricia ZAS-9]